MKVAELKRLLSLHDDDDEVLPNGEDGFVIVSYTQAICDETTGWKLRCPEESRMWRRVNLRKESK